jgi:hypothetical protein
MIKSDRVTVWKFLAAPSEFQKLHRSGVEPHWIAVIPAAIYGSDLRSSILAQSKLADLREYRSEGGDVVYMGSSGMMDLLDLVGAVDSSAKKIQLDDRDF